MAAIKVRIHCEDHFTHEDVINVLGWDLFLVEEVGELGRPHYQGLLYAEPTKEELKRLRNSVVRKLGITGNRAYSIAEAPEPDGYVRYLCKGASCNELPIVLCNSRGVDTTGGHVAFWAEHGRLVEENPKGYRRRSVWNELQLVTDPCMGVVDIGLKALELYHGGGKIANPNVIKNMVFTIRAKDPQRARYMMADLLKGL